MKIGIVGNGKDKFTHIGELRAKFEIENIMLMHPYDTFVSGHSPMGGVDIWVEELAKNLHMKTQIFAPAVNSWEDGKALEFDGDVVTLCGYKSRNLEIAKSDIVYIIVADSYPSDYHGRMFSECYHCLKFLHVDTNQPWHVKSGGCFTGIKASQSGHEAYWIVIENDGKKYR